MSIMYCKAREKKSKNKKPKKKRQRTPRHKNEPRVPMLNCHDKNKIKNKKHDIHIIEFC